MVYRNWSSAATVDEEIGHPTTAIGRVGMVDPPRPGVADAVAQAHLAGLRIHMVTGDDGLTAAEIAHQVGIGAVEAGSAPVPSWMRCRPAS